jgi:hypothetical protein
VDLRRQIAITGRSALIASMVPGGLRHEQLLPKVYEARATLIVGQPRRSEP